MPLQHEPDPTVADWLCEDSGEVLLTQGPAGFEAYATVRFDGEDADPYRPDPEVVALVTRLAAEHTGTPDRTFFALWDGWGEIDEGRFYGVMDVERGFGRVFSTRPSRVAPPAFDDAVLAAPRLELAESRSYLLFTGPASEVGEWDARPLAPGWPRDLPQASFTWPADHAWCIASDVDPAWCTVGGSQALVDAVVAHPDLRAEPATHGSPPPPPA